MARVQFECEFTVRSSPSILFNFLTTPEGLIQWFADKVDHVETDYSFFWEGEEEKAELVEAVDGELVKYIWVDGEEDEFLEFRISKAEITNDTILTVIDFTDDYDIEDQTQLWESQIQTLRTKIGG